MGIQNFNQSEKSKSEPISIFGLANFYATHGCHNYRKNKKLYISTSILFNYKLKHRKDNFVSKKLY